MDHGKNTSEINNNRLNMRLKKTQRFKLVEVIQRANY